MGTEKVYTAGLLACICVNDLCNAMRGANVMGPVRVLVAHKKADRSIRPVGCVFSRERQALGAAKN